MPKYGVIDESVNVLADRIREGEISPTELIEKYLDCIDARDGDINAYVTVTDELAVESAVNAETAVEDGNKPGPLHGVPIALDDAGYLKEGVPQTFGSPAFAEAGFIAPRTEVVTQRLETAGAIILGKTNLPDFGHKGMTDNNFAGATATPFDPTKNAGGHCGGAAAAVAAGMAPAAAGSDGGGSIRIPAATCGVYGVKPSPGLIPFDNRMNAFGRHAFYNVLGPITRTVDDAALLLEVMAGRHPSDPRSVPVEPDFRAATDRPLTGLRVAFSPDFDGFEVDDAVASVVREALDAFNGTDATVENISIDHGFEIGELADVIQLGWASEFAAGVEMLREVAGVDIGTHPETAESLQRWLELADGATYTEVSLTGIQRTQLYHAVQSIFENYDLLVTPTLGRVGIDLHQGTDAHLEWLRTSVLTWLFNLTGHPAASVPAGLTDSGLPVGIQLVGPWFKDDIVLAASAGFERQRPWIDSYSSLTVSA